MINLLDSSAKREIRAAQLNVTLLTYCLIIGIVLVITLLLTVFSYWWLGNRITAAHNVQTANDANNGTYAPVRAQANTFSTNLGKIQSALANRSEYSTALFNIATSLPAGATISTLTFAPTFVTTPLSITATTPDYPSAVALSQTLAHSPIYSKVTLVNANCNAAKIGCDVSITATLNSKVFTTGAVQ